MSTIAGRPSAVDAATAPAKRPIAYATPHVTCENLADGGMICRAADALLPYDPSLARLFRAAVERHPGRTFLAERTPNGGWRKVTYEAARPAVDALAQGLITRGVSIERPLMILSGNSIDHALLMLAAHCAGVPVAPISVAYSLQSQDFSKLKYIATLVGPAMIYVADTAPYARALGALDLRGVEIVATRNGAKLDNVTLLEQLMQRPGPALEVAVRATGTDTVAKILFTSGSTSLPKGVINTHGMLTANQQQAAQIWPFITEQPLVLVDWLPWNHTFGGNHNFNLVLRHGGTLHIDGGKPLPGLIEQTVQNLAEISPTIYFNVPAGYASLLPFLERDEQLAGAFFAKLRLILYAAAGLPSDLWERLERVAARTCGEVIPMTSSWGSTETSPLATAAHFPLDHAGPIGVPVPGLELKLAPAGAKLEARVRGPNVTPGYWKRPDLTRAAFDPDGYYKMGDAVRLVEPRNPSRGIVFDGRLSEDFKLTTGTWVSAGALRVAALGAASPVLQDLLVAGENRNFVGLLAWINVPACQQLVGEGATSDIRALSQDPRVREHVRSAFTGWNSGQAGSSHRISRVFLLPDTPSVDANEITDKGYINQRLALDRRAAEVERLFSAKPDADVIVVAPAD